MKFIHTLQSRAGRPIDFKKADAKISKLAKNSHLRLLYVYGSYASAKASKLSDLDIAFLSDQKMSSDEKLTLIEKLQDIFKEEAIDLVDLKTAPLPLTHRVFKEGQCLYAKNLSCKIDFETRCELLYLDTTPLRKEQEHFLMRRIENGTFGYRSRKINDSAKSARRTHRQA